jgi:hypothetical protein
MGQAQATVDAAAVAPIVTGVEHRPIDADTAVAHGGIRLFYDGAQAAAIVRHIALDDAVLDA